MGDAVETVLVMLERAKLLLVTRAAVGDLDAAMLLDFVGDALPHARELAAMPRDHRVHDQVKRVASVACKIHYQVHDYAERHGLRYAASPTPVPPPRDTTPCDPSFEDDVEAKSAVVAIPRAPSVPADLEIAALGAGQ